MSLDILAIHFSPWIVYFRCVGVYFKEFDFIFDWIFFFKRDILMYVFSMIF